MIPDLAVVHHIANATVQAITPVVTQSVPTLQPDSAPLWLDVFIWMALFWQWILIGFIPAFYVAVVKLFGMPLLQRWKTDVVIILYPNKVKFGKFKEQFDPYFKDGKGVYWSDDVISPKSFETPYEELSPKLLTKLESLKQKYVVILNKEVKTKEDEKMMKVLLKQADKIVAHGLSVKPINDIHVFSHAVNQELTSNTRRQTKIDEILNNNANPKKLPSHGIWIMQNPRLHFHRHYQLIISIDKEEKKTYILKPVKDRQQFGIGFWHSLGVEINREVEGEHEEEVESSSGGSQKQIISTTLTKTVILQTTAVFQHDQNMSASRAFMLLAHRAKNENKFTGVEAMITGRFDVRILLLLAGMLGVVGMLFLLLHGNAPPTQGVPTPPGVVHIL